MTNLIKFMFIVMSRNDEIWDDRTVADPGFPRVGGANPKVGVPTYYSVKVFPKTAWKWKNLDRGGGGLASLAPHLDPPMQKTEYPVLCTTHHRKISFGKAQLWWTAVLKRKFQKIAWLQMKKLTNENTGIQIIHGNKYSSSTLKLNLTLKKHKY